MKLKQYQEIIGESEISEIYRLSDKLKDKRIIMINSTNKGGGVAEILSRLVPLLNEVDVKTEWIVLNAEKEFFEVTKLFHNCLQGEVCENINEKIQNYKDFYDNEMKNLNKHIIEYLGNSSHSDIFMVHDPQPLNLITLKNGNGTKWIWRKHIDTSEAHPKLWDYVYGLASKYDKIVVSKKDFVKGDMKKYSIIPPSIDPFSDKNRELNEKELEEIIKKYNIPADKPIITQISRLDKWKDPIGVIDVFREVRKKADCRLILAYNEAKDDPEGETMYKKVLRAEQQLNKGDIILLGVHDDLLVNALQRVSSAILQKSLKEGFALTVSEALWKKTPVIGSRVGGIPLQIKHGKNGYLVKGYRIDSEGNPISIEERKLHIKKTAKYVVDILKNPVKKEKMGNYGKEHVRKNFLITRHMKDYLKLFNSLYEEKGLSHQRSSYMDYN